MTSYKPFTIKLEGSQTLNFPFEREMNCHSGGFFLLYFLINKYYTCKWNKKKPKVKNERVKINLYLN